MYRTLQRRSFKFNSDFRNELWPIVGVSVALALYYLAPQMTNKLQYRMRMRMKQMPGFGTVLCRGLFGLHDIRTQSGAWV